VPNITVNLVAPEQQAPVVVVQSPAPVASAEKTYPYIPPEQRQTEQKRVPTRKEKSSEPEQKTVPDPNKKSSDQGTKRVPGSNENNSQTIPDKIIGPIVSELSEPHAMATEAPSHDSEPYKKKGKSGRERDYKKVRKVFLYRVKMGRYQIDLSKEMGEYYDYWYFEKPNKRRDGKDYERHVRSYSRGQAWLAETGGA
jgi:hypothetical protein